MSVKKRYLPFADVEYYNSPCKAPHSTRGMACHWKSGESQEKSDLAVAGSDYKHTRSKSCFTISGHVV